MKTKNSASNEIATTPKSRWARPALMASALSLATFATFAVTGCQTSDSRSGTHSMGGPKSPATMSDDSMYNR
jgi:hypothetical protein